jgi:hypothetical protein
MKRPEAPRSKQKIPEAQTSNAPGPGICEKQLTHTNAMNLLEMRIKILAIILNKVLRSDT